MYSEFAQADYYRLKTENERLQRKLRSMKTLFDAIRNRSTTITCGTEDFDDTNHVYDVRVILGQIETDIYDALRLNHPGGNPIGWDVSHNNT